MHHNRMKRSFAFLLTMAMLLSLCLGAAGAQYPCVGFAARKLTVTRSASATGETLYTVPAGDAVYITGDSGDYYIIEYDGQPGYAAKSAVRLAGEVLSITQTARGWAPIPPCARATKASWCANCSPR